MARSDPEGAGLVAAEGEKEEPLEDEEEEPLEEEEEEEELLEDERSECWRFFWRLPFFMFFVDLDSDSSGRSYPCDMQKPI